MIDRHLDSEVFKFYQIFEMTEKDHLSSYFCEPSLRSCEFLCCLLLVPVINNIEHLGEHFLLSQIKLG